MNSIKMASPSGAFAPAVPSTAAATTIHNTSTSRHCPPLRTVSVLSTTAETTPKMLLESSSAQNSSHCNADRMVSESSTAPSTTTEDDETTTSKSTLTAAAAAAAAGVMTTFHQEQHGPGDMRQHESHEIHAHVERHVTTKRKVSDDISTLDLPPPHKKKRMEAAAHAAAAEYGYQLSSFALPSAATSRPAVDRDPTNTPKQQIMLLAQPGDEEALNPLHVFVRQQIEVFTATAEELSQPAPGRKIPIKLHQVGLRCIHCRHFVTGGNNNTGNNGQRQQQPNKKRVKRAVCYPSSVARVYHSVSDMKFDHFGHCQELPPHIRETFERLRVEGNTKRAASPPSTKKGYSNTAASSGASVPSSTAQYYHDSAVRMGMVDGPDGIFMENVSGSVLDSPDASSLPLPSTRTAQEGHQKDKTSISSSSAQTTIEMARVTSMPGSLAAATIDGLLSSPHGGMFPMDSSTIAFLIQQQQKQGNSFVSLSDLLPSPAPSRPFIWNELLKKVVAGESFTRPTSQGSLPLMYLQTIHTQNTADTTETSRRQDQPSLSLPPQAMSSSTVSSIVRSSADAVTIKSPPKLTSKRSRKNNIGRPPRGATMALPLSDPEDADYLNPLHCFVRRHIELFAADAEACAAPAPGRKARVVVGQVGLRCIHCGNLPAKERVKRSVCYPPSVAGIYHAVSNMKFDHFAICKGLPQPARDEFTALRHECSRRGTAGNNCQRNKTTKEIPESSGSSTGSTGNSTAQYYHESAVNKGLVDSDNGIRFSDRSMGSVTISTSSSDDTRTDSPSNGKKGKPSQDRDFDDRNGGSAPTGSGLSLSSRMPSSAGAATLSSSKARATGVDVTTAAPVAVTAGSSSSSSLTLSPSYDVASTLGASPPRSTKGRYIAGRNHSTIPLTGMTALMMAASQAA